MNKNCENKILQFSKKIYYFIKGGIYKCKIIEYKLFIYYTNIRQPGEKAPNKN